MALIKWGNALIRWTPSPVFFLFTLVFVGGAQSSRADSDFADGVALVVQAGVVLLAVQLFLSVILTAFTSQPNTGGETE